MALLTVACLALGPGDTMSIPTPIVPPGTPVPTVPSLTPGPTMTPIGADLGGQPTDTPPAVSVTPTGVPTQAPFSTIAESPTLLPTDWEPPPFPFERSTGVSMGDLRVVMLEWDNWRRVGEGEVVVTVIVHAVGGDGNYAYYLDGILQEGPIFEVRGAYCRPSPHVIIVQSGDGQMLRYRADLEPDEPDYMGGEGCG